MSGLSPLSRRIAQRANREPDRAYADFPAPVRAMVDAMDEARQMQSGAVYVLSSPEAAKAKLAALVEAGLPAYLEAVAESLLFEPSHPVRRATA